MLKKSYITGVNTANSIFLFVLSIGRVGFTIATWGKSPMVRGCFTIMSTLVGLIAFVALITYAVCVYILLEENFTWFARYRYKDLGGTNNFRGGPFISV